MPIVTKTEYKNHIGLFSDKLLYELKIGIHNVRDYLDELKNGIYMYGMDNQPFITFLTNNG
jgi:hypothetical protein